MKNTENISGYMSQLETVCRKNDNIAPCLYDEYGVNKGLRDKNGNGVPAEPQADASSAVRSRVEMKRFFMG